VRILITGGRDFWNEVQMAADFQALLSRGLTVVIHGKNPNGADALADRLARALLGDDGVRDRPADWNSFGKGAGPKRNIQMLDEEHPDLVMGYPTPKSRGTWHCIAEAAARDLPILAFIPWWSGDIAELVERETRRYGKVATGVRRGTHVVVSRVDRGDRTS